MDNTLQYLLIGYIAFFTFVFSLFLFFYYDGVRFGLYRKIMCKLGFHKLSKRFGKLVIPKYYCDNCKTARKHPKLTVIDGGKKFG